MMAHPAGGGASIDTLKRIKAAEETAEAKLSALRSEGADRLARLRREATEAIAQVKQAAEASHAATLASAKGAADAEAAQLLAEGRKAAQLLEMKATQTVAAKRDKVLGVVLHGFQPSDGD